MILSSNNTGLQTLASSSGGNEEGSTISSTKNYSSSRIVGAAACKSYKLSVCTSKLMRARRITKMLAVLHQLRKSLRRQMRLRRPRRASGKSHKFLEWVASSIVHYADTREIPFQYSHFQRPTPRYAEMKIRSMTGERSL